jgi:hypothetical protein
LENDGSEFSLAATFNDDHGVTLGIVNVRFYPKLLLTQDDAREATDQDVADLDAELKKGLLESEKVFGLTVTSWAGTKKIILNGTTVFLTEYRRKALRVEGEFNVRLVRVFSGNRSVTVTVSYLESAGIILRPISDRIINSLNMDSAKIPIQDVSVEQNLYAVLQVSNPNNSKIQVDIKSDVESKSYGEILNQATWNGLKNSCPECVLDYSKVVTSLSPEFELTFANQRISATYLRLDKERIIFVGFSAQEGLASCQVMAESFRKSGRAADCIQGIQ